MLDEDNSWPPEPTAPAETNLEETRRRPLPIFIWVGAVLNALAIMATAPAYIPKFYEFYNSGYGVLGALFVGSGIGCICAGIAAGIAARRSSDKRAWWGVALCLLPIAVAIGILAFAPGQGDCGCGG